MKNVPLTLQQAIEEAQRCLLCHDSPCSTGCPGGTDPGKFIRQIRFYNFKGAARTVLGNNPLGGACAFICPTGDTCERNCVRADIDRPVDIAALQRFAVAYGREHGVAAMTAGEPRPERVAIVGAGPAGLAAAAKLAQHGYPVTLFEARDKIGGMLRYGVPQSRLGDQALDADLDQILALGVKVETSQSIDPDRAAKLLDDGFAAVFLAPGLWRPARLDLPGSDLPGVSTALDFLRQVYSEPEAARALVGDRNLAIIGGGSVAMDVARCARELGARRIYAIALEGMTELPAQPDELHQAFADGVMLKPQCRVTRIVGEGGQLVAVEGVETEWIEPGKLVPDNARDVAGTSFRVAVGAVIQAIGQRPDDHAAAMPRGARRTGTLLSADPASGETSVAGIFAGGDIVRGASTVVAAVGDGKRAAAAIHARLSGSQEVAR